MSIFYLLRGIDYIIGRGREGREGGGGKSRQASCLKGKRIANQLAREEEEEEWGVTKFVVRGR